MQVKGLGVAGKTHITISDAYIYNFSPQIFPWFQILMCFVTPRGPKGDFRKIVEYAMKWTYLYQFSAF